MTSVKSAAKAQPTLWLLGAATALAPFGASVHIPALASIPRDLGASGRGANTVSIYLIMFSAAMIPQGWLSDRFGRRPPALASLAVLAAASLGAAVAPSMGFLLIARALQGASAAGVLVIARASVRDAFAGQEGTRAMSVLSTLQTVGIAFAPVVGGLVGWRWGFGVLGFGAMAVVALATTKWTETRSPSPTDEVQSPRGLAVLLSRTSFAPYTVAVGAMTMVYFAFLSSSPALLVGSGRLTPRSFSLVLLGAAAVSVLGGLFTRTMAPRTSGARLSLLGGAVVCVGVAGFVAAWLTNAGANAWCASLLVYMLGNGIMMPAAITSALQIPARVVGLGSSILGTFQFLLGAIAAAGVERFGVPSRALALTSSMAATAMVASLVLAELRSRAHALPRHALHPRSHP